MVSGFDRVSGLLGLEDEGECEDEGSGSASIFSVESWVRGTKQMGSGFIGEEVGS